MPAFNKLYFKLYFESKSNIQHFRKKIGSRTQPPFQSDSILKAQYYWKTCWKFQWSLESRKLYSNEENQKGQQKPIF